MIDRISAILSHAGFKKYFANVGWSFLAKIGTMVVSFFVTIYVVRYLGPTNFGILSYAISFVGIFSFIATLGIDSILYRDLVKYPEKSAQLFGTAIGLRYIGAIVAFICVVVAAYMFEQTEHMLILLIITLTFFFQPISITTYYFQSRVETKKIVLVGFLSIILLSFAKLILVILNAELIYFAGVYLLEPILFAIAYSWKYHQAGGRMSSWKLDLNVAKQILAASWPLMFSSAFTYIYTRIDQVMIKNMLDTYSVGIYSAAAQLSEYWYFIPVAIVSALIPGIINGKKTSTYEYRRRIKALFGLIVLVAASVGIFFSFFSPSIVKIVYGISYLEAAPILVIYVWGGIGMSLGIIANQILIIENKTKIFFYINLLSMFVNLGLNYYLIPIFGMRGAAWATLISYSLIPLPMLFIRLSQYENA